MVNLQCCCPANDSFALPLQLSPSPCCLPSFMFLWRLEKKSHHGRLGSWMEPYPAVPISGMAIPYFSQRNDHRKFAAVSVAAVVLQQEEEETLIKPYNLPFNANSSLAIESWGTIYTGPNDSKYWNLTKSYPYPVGYTSIKTYKGQQYWQTIKEGTDGPVFVVEEAGKGVFSSESPQKVWNDVVREDGQHVQGARHFGFQSPEVVKALRALLKLHKGDNKEETLSEIEAEEHDDCMAITNERQVSDTIRSESDQEFSKVEMMLQDEEEDEEEEEEEEEEEDDDDNDVVVDDDDNEDDELQDVEDHDADDDNDHDLESDDDDDGERDHLSFNVYSNKRRVHADGDSHAFDDTGSLLNNFEHAFRSTYTESNFDRFEKYDAVEEASKEDIGVASNAVYFRPDHLRPKSAGTVEKRVWRKGEGLTGHGVGYGKQGVERLGGDQRSLSSEGAQPRVTTSLSFNGSKSWDSPFPRKREESSKSSHMLLELLQKWNKVKRWNREPGERLRGRVESKQLQLQEESEQHQDVVGGDERASMPLNKPIFQGPVSESKPTTLKGNLFSAHLRNFQGQETVQSSFFSSEDGESALDELSMSDDVDESTDYAISRLFETVGKKNVLLTGIKSPPRLGRLVAENPRTINHVEKSWNNAATSRPTETVNYQTSLERADSLKGITKMDQDESKVSYFTEKRVSSNGMSEAIKKTAVDTESTQLMGRGEQTPEKKKVEEIRLIEDVRKLVGNKRFEDALSAVKGAKLSGLDVQEDVYEALLGGVKLDSWQKQVFKHVQNGNSVLVSAPSGAGKSVAAECCLYRNVIQGHRTLFVTPYEHLARQKLHNLGSIFGHGNVGGTLTRMRVQKDHKLVVLTLETLAKMLQELNGPGGSEFRFFFEGVNLVVLDKFHTFGEANYGNAWEEVLMLMDAKIRVIALTLPASNEDQIVSWIDANRGPCKIVSCRSDPVPKRYLLCHESGLLPLLDAKSVQLNDVFSEASGGYDNSMTKEQLESFFWSGYDKPSLKCALSLLEDNAMLPAFLVFYNVKSCGDAMQDALAALGEGLLSRPELAKLETRMNELAESHPDLSKHIEEEDREALCKGIAAYHEGKLPVWQTFVLELFQENLLKLLIVTETILLHTELVARTVILPATCKVLKDGVFPIPSEQALQMFGSAGRRGYDIEGNVVFLKSFYSSPKEAESLVLENSFKISSCYKPSYSLVANLMAKHNLSKVKQILGGSLRDFVYYNTHAKDKKLEDLNKKILDCLESKADFEVKLFQGLTEVNKQKLLDAAMFTRVDIRMTIHSAAQSGNVFPGFLLAIVPGQAESFYMVFGADNNFRLLPAGALDHVYTKELTPLDVLYKQSTGLPLQPPVIPPKESWTVDHDGTCGYVARGNSQTKEYVKLLMDYPIQFNVVKEGLHLRKEVLLLEAQISNLIEKRRSLHTDKQNGDEMLLSSGEIDEATLQLDESESWKEALRLVKILERLDALSLIERQGAHVKLKPLGMLISRLHNVDNELWVAVVVMSNYVKQLLPAEFAGIIAAMVPLEPEVEGLFSDQREVLYRSTKSLKDAFTKLEVLRKQLAALQGSYTPPLQFGTAFAGMVYAWARGKPGTVGFTIVSTNDGDVAWKLRSVAKFANLVSRACSQVSVDISEPNDFSNLSTVARRAEELLSRHLTAVDRNM